MRPIFSLRKCDKSKRGSTSSSYDRPLIVTLIVLFIKSTLAFGIGCVKLRALERLPNFRNFPSSIRFG